jgi:hypothetical protein
VHQPEVHRQDFWQGAYDRHIFEIRTACYAPYACSLPVGRLNEGASSAASDDQLELAVVFEHLRHWSAGALERDDAKLEGIAMTLSAVPKLYQHSLRLGRIMQEMPPQVCSALQ